MVGWLEQSSCGRSLGKACQPVVGISASWDALFKSVLNGKADGRWRGLELGLQRFPFLRDATESGGPSWPLPVSTWRAVDFVRGSTWFPSSWVLIAVSLWSRLPSCGGFSA